MIAYLIILGAALVQFINGKTEAGLLTLICMYLLRVIELLNTLISQNKGSK